MESVAKKKVAAGIVLFNPNPIRLRECISKLRGQVGCIIIYDNSLVNSYRNFMKENVVYLSRHQNDGISYALNQIFLKGKEMGYEWILTMDQDTIIPINLISTFSKYMMQKKVGIICPQVVDRRRVYLHPKYVPNDTSYIDFCITSASCTNINIWEELGGFDNYLFIDFVDNDYCKRLVLSGYKILQCNKVVIDQEFGNITLKSQFWVGFYISLSHFLKNKNIAKLSYKKKVNPMRVYYVHRNLLYLNKKLKNYGGIGYGNFYCHSFFGFLIYFTLPSFVRGSEKRKIFKATIKGLYDGYKSKVKCFEIK
jgi:GT2 family glycosyltransferase